MNLSVNLTKRVKTAEGLRFCAAVVSSNGKIKPDWVLVAGQEERHPEGSYYIGWYEGSKLRQKSVGKNAATAGARRVQMEHRLKARSQGLVLSESEGNPDTRRPLAQAVIEYLNDTRLTKKKTTIAAYTKSLGLFQQSCKKQHLEEIDRQDMLRFGSFLKEKGLAPRSQWNRFNNVMSFLKAYEIRGIVKPRDWPRFVSRQVEAFEKDELDILFSHATEEESLWWDFFLVTGMRELEVVHCTWDCINFKQKTIRVQRNEQYGWDPKSYKSREIPVPTRLLQRLEKKRPRQYVGVLVFSTFKGLRKLDFLDCLKRTAKRAGLTQTRCYLHKFRSTFCTLHLRSGTDVATVQSWMGHNDLASTARYIQTARGKSVSDRVDSVFAMV